MDREKCSLMLALALLTGLVLGVVSSRFFVGNSALAEEKAQSQRVLVAREFRLVDDNGKTIAVLGGRPGKAPFLPILPDLRFYGEDGELRIFVGLMPGDKPIISLSGAGREVIWKAP